VSGVVRAMDEIFSSERHFFWKFLIFIKYIKIGKKSFTVFQLNKILMAIGFVYFKKIKSSDAAAFTRNDGRWRKNTFWKT